MRSYDIRASVLADLLFALAAITPVLVLAGWRLNSPMLRSFGIGDYPDWPITAICNLVLSIALLSIDRIAEPVRRLLLALPATVALLVLVEYAAGRPLGLDRLLFPSALGQFNLPHPGRPGLIPIVSLLAMTLAAWRANRVQRDGDTIVFLLGCAMVGLSAMSLALLVLRETEFSQQSTRMAASLPVTLMLLFQASGLLVWLAKHQRGLPWSRGRGMRPVNLALVAVLVLPAILLPIQIKVAEVALLAQLPAEILASAANVLLVVGLLGWAIERLSREQNALQQTTEALRASEEKLLLAIEAHELGLFEWDIVTGRLQWNAGAEQRFGLPAGTISDFNSWAALVEPDDVSAVRRIVADAAARRAERFAFRYRLHPPGGKPRVIEGSARCFYDSGGKLVRAVGINVDVTEREEREEHMEQLNAEYAHSARLNAMGEMAAALAHELNQPLAATANYLGVAELSLTTRDGIARAGEAIEQASAQLMRTGEIIRRLRDFVAKRDIELQAEDLSQVIHDAAALAFLGQLEVRATYDIAPDARLVVADRIQVQQVLVNVLRNAGEAVRELPAECRTISVSARAVDRDFVEVTVADQGPGFPRKVLANFHAPFLSTKTQGGMGIGLAISRRIIEAHGGALSARNARGGGAVLSFTLPLYREEGEDAA